MNEILDAVIIGAGPCGIKAALMFKEAGLSFEIIEKSTPGGKVNIAPRVDNYPGFKKIPGPDLAVAFYERLVNAGIKLVGDEVTSLTKEDDIFVIKCLRNTFKSKTVLIASGTQERKLGLENEDKLFAHGISYCAVCDGHFFKGQDVLVIGGGNSALKEAIYLSDIVKHVYLIHRRKEFRGFNKIVDELAAKDNTTILTPYTAKAFLGEDKVSGAIITNVETGEDVTLDVQGIFPLVGQIPNSTFINIEGVKNEYGNIPTDLKTMATSVPGLYAGGDILPRDIRQIYLSEHDGQVAATDMMKYLGK